MDKKIQQHVTGQHSRVGEFDVVRALPHRDIRSVGPFVFVDQLPDLSFAPRTPSRQDGSEAHPHRGIITLSYSLEGEFYHYDSLGNSSIVGDGGAQWLKAGRGVVHDGGLSGSFQERGGNVNAFQFWINLTAEHKTDHPDYMQVLAKDMPQVALDDGFLRVVLGKFETRTSPLPTMADELVYHVSLNPGGGHVFGANPGLEYGVYAARGNVTVNDQTLNPTELVTLSVSGEDIRIDNPTNDRVHVMVFGGLPYTEPIVFGGPFVMNTQDELAMAAAEYQQGLYGQVRYPHNLDDSTQPLKNRTTK